MNAREEQKLDEIRHGYTKKRIWDHWDKKFNYDFVFQNKNKNKSK